MEPGPDFAQGLRRASSPHPVQSGLRSLAELGQAGRLHLRLRTCEKIRIIAPTQASPKAPPRRAVWSFDSAQDTEPAEVRSYKKAHNFIKYVG